MTLGLQEILCILVSRIVIADELHSILTPAAKGLFSWKGALLSSGGSFAPKPAPLTTTVSRWGSCLHSQVSSSQQSKDAGNLTAAEGAL